MILVFTTLLLIPLFPQSYGVTTSLGKLCLNEDGLRELDFRYTVGVQEFDELNKQVYVTIDVDADDEDEQTESFEVFHRRYPYLGAQVIHVIENDDKGYFETEANQKIHERNITPIFNFPNPWPYQTYKIPMFLEFDKDVKLCYTTWDDGGSDIDIRKSGDFSKNPSWNLKITSHETSFDELQKLIPDIKPRFEDSTIFQFDVEITSTENYQLKIIPYLFLTGSPILLMIGHALWIRSEKLVLHVTFFATVSILILSSIVAMVDFAPSELTWFEILTISSITSYVIGFFVFLVRRKNRDSINIISKENSDIKKTPQYRDKVWKKFTIVFGVLMMALVSVFILASWNDTSTITTKISDIASIFGVFLAVYIAVWVYKVEMNKKSEKENRQNYFKKMTVLALGTTREKLHLIKEHANIPMEINQEIIDEWNSLKIPAERFEMIVIMAGDSLNHEISDDLDLIRGTLKSSANSDFQMFIFEIEKLEKLIMSLLTEKLDSVRAEVLKEYMDKINRSKENNNMTQIEFDVNKRRFERMYGN